MSSSFLLFGIRPMRFALVASSLLLVAVPVEAAQPITGRWLTDGGKAVVSIGRCGRQLCGRVERVLRAPPGSPRTDAHNPNPALRGRPIVGVAILSGFSEDGDAWRGRIYNPEDGRSYKSIVRREGDALKVKGCIVFFCRTQIWRPAR